jgi:hypothetical protein
MLTVFTISTLVLAITIGFLLIKNYRLQNKIVSLTSQLELSEAELDIALLINKSLKSEAQSTAKPTEPKKKSPSKKKYYPRKPKTTESKPNA